MNARVIPINPAEFGLNEPPDDVSRLRIPPHSIEAEHAVLGCLMQDPAAFALIADTVIAADFFRHEHKLIFSAVAELAGAGQPADIITVFERLTICGQADAAGGLVYLNEVATCLIGAGHVMRYAEIVAERATLRALIAATDELSTAAFAPSGRSAADLLDDARALIGRLDDRSKGSRRHRVPLLGLDELRQSAEAVRWLCKRTIPADSIGMLFGGSGTFKSYLALDLSLHVCHGLPWMGRKTKKGAVIYIAAEGGAGLWTRILAWHRARGLDWRTTPLKVVPVAVDLTQDAWRIVDAAQVAGVTPELVVVDTLSQTYAGEENSANEMAAYLRALGSRFRALWHCTVLLIHHSGHAATERPRGSSAIRANIDFLLGAFRDEKEMLATVTCSKQKDGDLFEDASFQLHVQKVGVDEDGDDQTQLVARHLSSAEEVSQAMEAERKSGRGGKNQLLLTLARHGDKESALRKEFYDLCELDSQDARRQAYFRALGWAKKNGFLQIIDGILSVTQEGY